MKKIKINLFTEVNRKGDAINEFANFVIKRYGNIMGYYKDKRKKFIRLKILVANYKSKDILLNSEKVEKLAFQMFGKKNIIEVTKITKPYHYMFYPYFCIYFQKKNYSSKVFKIGFNEVLKKFNYIISFDTGCPGMPFIYIESKFSKEWTDNQNNAETFNTEKDANNFMKKYKPFVKKYKVIPNEINVRTKKRLTDEV